MQTDTPLFPEQPNRWAIPSIFWALALSVVLTVAFLDSGYTWVIPIFHLFSAYLLSKIFSVDLPTFRELLLWLGILAVAFLYFQLVSNANPQGALEIPLELPVFVGLPTIIGAVMIRTIDYTKSFMARGNPTLPRTVFHDLPAFCYLGVVILGLVWLGSFNEPGDEFYEVRLASLIALGWFPIATVLAYKVLKPRLTKRSIRTTYLPISLAMVLAITCLGLVLDLRGPIAFNPGIIVLILTMTVPMPVLLATLEFLRTYDRKNPRNNLRNSS